jgi:putative transposase
MKYKPFPIETRLYFVTSVLSRHKPIFRNDYLSLPVLQAMDYYAQRGEWLLFAFCLMPNHLHALLQMTGANTIQKQMGEFHKWTAHKIVELLRESEERRSLEFFRSMASGRKDRSHLVWDDAIAKPVFTERYMFEVMEYIHNNPCKAPWNLARDRSEYRYSSAKFYDCGEMAIIPVEDIRKHWFSLA